MDDDAESEDLGRLGQKSNEMETQDRAGWEQAVGPDRLGGILS